jgi:hypothetical protein
VRTESNGSYVASLSASSPHPLCIFSHKMGACSFQYCTDASYFSLSSGTPEPPSSRPNLVTQTLATPYEGTDFSTPPPRRQWVCRWTPNLRPPHAMARVHSRVTHHGDGLHGQLKVLVLRLDGDDAPRRVRKFAFLRLDAPRQPSHFPTHASLTTLNLTPRRRCRLRVVGSRRRRTARTCLDAIASRSWISCSREYRMTSSILASGGSPTASACTSHPYRAMTPPQLMSVRRPCRAAPGSLHPGRSLCL